MNITNAERMVASSYYESRRAGVYPALTVGMLLHFGMPSAYNINSATVGYLPIKRSIVTETKRRIAKNSDIACYNFADIRWNLRLGLKLFREALDNTNGDVFLLLQSFAFQYAGLKRTDVIRFPDDILVQWQIVAQAVSHGE